MSGKNLTHRFSICLGALVLEFAVAAESADAVVADALSATATDIVPADEILSVDRVMVWRVVG